MMAAKDVGARVHDWWVALPAGGVAGAVVALVVVWYLLRRR